MAGIVVSDDRQFIGEIRLREWEKVLRLITIALNPAPSTSEYKDFQHTLRRHSKHPLKPLSEEEVDRWFSFDSFKQLLGLVGMNSEDSGGLYSLHAHLNHSCEPNVQVRSCLAITDIQGSQFPKRLCASTSTDPVARPFLHARYEPFDYALSTNHSPRRGAHYLVRGSWVESRAAIGV